MPQRVVFTGKNQVSLENFELQTLQPNEIKVKMLLSLISSGTEGIVLHRKFDAGTHYDDWVKYPFYPGYSSLGEVVEVGASVTKFSVGDRVVHRNGHSQFDILSETDRFLVIVPQNIDPKDAVWFALAKIAAMALPVCGNLCGKRVVMLGAGPIGQMLGRWLSAAGVSELLAVDPVDFRLQLLRKDVEAKTLACSSRDAVAEVMRLTDTAGADVVVDTTGNAAVFEDALKMVRKFGKVVLLGDTGTPANQRLTPDVIMKGVIIAGAHDSHENPQWNTPVILKLWFSFLGSGKIKLSNLNTHIMDYHEVVSAYAAATENRTSALGVVFDWSNRD